MTDAAVRWCTIDPPAAEKDLVSPVRTSIDLPSVPASVPRARWVVRDVLSAWAAPQDRADAELLVTELVANAVDHAGADVLTVELELCGGWLRIGVVDGTAVRPVVRELSGLRERGRGMQLVTAIADRWGTEDHGGGKRVWFELALDARSEPA